MGGAVLGGTLAAGGMLSPVMTGLGVGIALASAPGPVQAVLLAESVRGGITRGFGALAGANLTFGFLLACLAFGLSLAAPRGPALAVLQMGGGAFLLWVSAEGFRSGPGSGPGQGPGIAAPGATEETTTNPIIHRELMQARIADRHRQAERDRMAQAASRASRARSDHGGHSGQDAGHGTARRFALPPAAVGALAVVLNPGAWLFLAAVASPLFASAQQRGGTGSALVVAVVVMAGLATGDGAVVLLGGIGLRRAGDRARQWVRRALAALLAGLGGWLLVTGVISLMGA
jgi:threonine/homoserine/homoserine lactone efflux protein